MLVWCLCNAFMVDPENATYVRDFQPLCHEETCKKVREHRARGFHRDHCDPGDEDNRIERQLTTRHLQAWKSNPCPDPGQEPLTEADEESRLDTRDLYPPRESINGR